VLVINCPPVFETLPRRRAMTVNKRHALKFAAPFIFLVVFAYGPLTPVAAGRQRNKPITKANLIASIKRNAASKPRKRLPAQWYVQTISGDGVDFPLTPEDEKKIRSAGNYFGETEIDNLIAAVRSSYRPNASPGAAGQVAGEKTQASKAPGSVEPTEAEMKEALLKMGVKQGGRRGPGDTLIFENIIAGVTYKIEKFEKLGCKSDGPGAVYECRYVITMSQSYHSNDGTEPGREQMAAWNLLMSGVGANIADGVATRKFALSSEGWMVFQD
jgi:hypothetical protein